MLLPVCRFSLPRCQDHNPPHRTRCPAAFRAYTVLSVSVPCHAVYWLLKHMAEVRARVYHDSRPKETVWLT